MQQDNEHERLLMITNKDKDATTIARRVESTLLTAATVIVMLMLAFLVFSDSRITW